MSAHPREPQKVTIQLFGRLEFTLSSDRIRNLRGAATAITVARNCGGGPARIPIPFTPGDTQKAGSINTLCADPIEPPHGCYSEIGHEYTGHEVTAFQPVLKSLKTAIMPHLRLVRGDMLRHNTRLACVKRWLGTYCIDQETR